LAVFGPFIEVLGHGGKGKFARKHRAHGKSGVSSPRGAGGQKAANHVFKAVRPDGLTIGAMLTGMVQGAVLGEPGGAGPLPPR